MCSLQATLPTEEWIGSSLSQQNVNAHVNISFRPLQATPPTEEEIEENLAGNLW